MSIALCQIAGSHLILDLLMVRDTFSSYLPSGSGSRDRSRSRSRSRPPSNAKVIQSGGSGSQSDRTAGSEAEHHELQAVKISSSPRPQRIITEGLELGMPIERDDVKRLTFLDMSGQTVIDGEQPQQVSLKAPIGFPVPLYR